jgi:hypothetical protein
MKLNGALLWLMASGVVADFRCPEGSHVVAVALHAEAKVDYMAALHCSDSTVLPLDIGDIATDSTLQVPTNMLGFCFMSWGVSELAEEEEDILSGLSFGACERDSKTLGPYGSAHAMQSSTNCPEGERLIGVGFNTEDPTLLHASKFYGVCGHGGAREYY